MRIGRWARLLLAAAPLVAGCGDFWQAPNNGTSFTLTSSPTSLTVAQGATGTSTITVTPANSFTGTVTLTCAVTSPSGTVVSATQCSLSPTSVSISSTTAQTAALTATTTATTTTGAYQLTVTGASSGATSETATVCVSVGTSSSGCASATSGDFYILNSTTISGYSINAGALTKLTNSPYALPSGVTPWAMAVDPSGSYLYVSTDTGVFLYDIGTGGALTLAQSSYVIGDAAAYAIKVDSTGNWLLDASGQGYLFAYPIGSKGIPTATNNPPSMPLLSSASLSKGGIVISADNKLIAVAEGSAGAQAFTFASGNANPFATIYKPATKGTAISVAFSPQSPPSFLYIGETGDFSTSGDSGGLRAISIASDVVGSDISGSPFQSGGTGPSAILPESAGNYVYVANVAGNATGVGFQVGSGGALLQLSSTFATGSEPTGLAEDNTDSFVLVVSSGGSPDFDAYSFSSSSGSLTSGITSSSTGTAPIAIVAVPK